jgi:hypothetical protein
MSTVCIVKARRIIASAILITSLASAVSLYIYEMKLSKEYTKYAPILSSEAKDVTHSESKILNKDRNRSFDPIEPITDPVYWERENQYTDTQNSLRIGWGPLMREQVDRGDFQDAVKVLVVGDSFVWGQAVENLDKRWPMQLEQELNKRSDGKIFQVETLGRPGANTANEASWINEENLAKIDPDIIVLSFLDNDYVPNFTEPSVCKQYNLCYNSNEDSDYNGLRGNLGACLIGDKSIFGVLARRVLNPFIPNITRNLLLRYCDPDKISAARGFMMEGPILLDPLKSPAWPEFKHSVNKFAKNAGKIPLYMSRISVMEMDKFKYDPIPPVFKEAGFNIVPMIMSNNLIKIVNSEKEFWVNPADRHASSMLAHTYATDTAIEILRGERQRESEPERDNYNSTLSSAPLISNYLPATMKYSKITRVFKGEDGFVITYNKPKYEDGLQTEANVSGKKLPAQYVPCARFGRPHARIVLNPYSDQNGNISIKVMNSSEPILVFTESADYTGRDVFGIPYLLYPGEIHIFDDAKSVTGLVVASKKNGCEQNEEINLTDFTLNISR